MKCAEALERLDDYEDGLLTEAELQQMELHLGGCSDCRAEELRLRALIRTAADGPREMDPPRDLWPGIAERVVADHVPVPARRVRRILSHPASLAAAAAVVVALSSVVMRHGPEPLPAAGGSTTAAAAGPSDHIQAAEVDYIRATGQLMDALNERSPLSPETRGAVDENLRVIDDALGQLRTALENDPGNRQLTRMLASTHQKKLDLLLRLLKLSARI
jgi:hypothetical protein